MTATPDSSPEPSEASRWWSFANQVRPKICSYTHAAAWLLVLVTLFRFWYATRFELVGDEAYYWLWSKNLDISYFSKGPGVAWTIALGRTLWGDSVFGVRFFAVLLSAATGGTLFLLARSLFSARVAYWSLVAILGVPLYSIGSVLMTIDPLSVFFWAATALAFWHAKDTTKAAPWAFTGFLVGLGMLCKYTNVAQLLCLALFCALFAPYRRHLASRRFWIMTGVALASLTPVLIWNARHDWVTFEHLWHRGSLDRSWRFSPEECFQFVFGQILVLTPFIAIGMIVAVVWALRRARSTAHCKELAFLLCLTLPLVAFYTILSFNESGEANWTSQAWVSGIILLVAVWQPWIDRSKSVRNLAMAGLGLALLATLLFHFASLTTTGIRPLDKLFSRTRGSADLARQVATIQQQYGATFVVANKYPIASLMSFYLPGQPRTHLPRDPSRRNQYSYWPDYSDGFLHESAIFVTDSDEIPSSLARDFASVELLKETEAIHQGRPVRSYRIYLLREFGSGTNFQRTP